jgi:hypothetical protein
VHCTMACVIRPAPSNSSRLAASGISTAPIHDSMMGCNQDWAAHLGCRQSSVGTWPQHLPSSLLMMQTCKNMDIVIRLVHSLPLEPVCA